MNNAITINVESDSNGDVKRRGNVTGGALDITDATAIQRCLAGFYDLYNIGKIVHIDEYGCRLYPINTKPIVDSLWAY